MLPGYDARRSRSPSLFSMCVCVCSSIAITKSRSLSACTKKKNEMREQSLASTLLICPQPFGMRAQRDRGGRAEWNEENRTLIIWFSAWNGCARIDFSIKICFIVSLDRVAHHQPHCSTPSLASSSVFFTSTSSQPSRDGFSFEYSLLGAHFCSLFCFYSFFVPSRSHQYVSVSC